MHSGNAPGGALLFSSSVIVPGATEAWRGATGLSWDVAAGDYTLTLIAQPGFNGGMRRSPSSPAGVEWIMNELSGDWHTTTFDHGWRIGVDPAAVPEPGSLALLALGLAALGAGAARRRSA